MFDVDFATAERFLQALDPAGMFCFQSFSDSSKNPALVRTLHGTFAEHQAQLARLNEAGAGVFVTVNKTDGRGRKTENITGVRAIFLDLDGAALPEGWPIEPHLIIETSPARFHCYWLVSSEDFPLDRFEPVQKAIAGRFGGDPAVCDLPRVMRLPGFFHLKKTPFLTRIARDWSGDPRYQPQQIFEVFPPVSERKTSRTDSVSDPILKALADKELLIGPGREKGMFRVICPWADQHTNGDGEAAYFLPYHGGFRGPGFKCLHGHCIDKKIEDVRGVLGVEDTDAWQMTRVSDLWEDAGEDISWTVENLIPSGSLGVLGGRPKEGKSTLARCLALSVATGRPFLGDLDVEQGDVLYMALEERRSSVVGQFKTLALSGLGMPESEAREALSHIGLICGPAPKGVLPKLRKLIAEHRPVLILVDTLARLLKLRDFNDYAETSTGLEALLHLAHDGPSILLLHHTKKGDGRDLLGSTGIQATPDTIITLARKDGTRTLSAIGRGVSFDETTLHYRHDGLYTMGVPLAEAEIQATATKIADFIRGSETGVSWRDIHEKVEGRNSSKQQALKRLEESGQIERRGTPRSKKDPLRFVFVPDKFCITRELRRRDAENGSSTSRILVPENLVPEKNRLSWELRWGGTP